MRRLVVSLIALSVGIGVAVVAYPYGFPGIYVATVISGDVAFLFLGAEGDLTPMVAFIGFILGLLIFCRAAPLN